METLKEFDELCQPDIRQSFMAVLEFNEKVGTISRPLTAKDIYGDAASIKLHSGVPDDIRSSFEVAKNLLAYSWFYYPFSYTARLQALTSAEFALRVKSGKKGSGLSSLLKQAIKEQWISDKGFSLPKRRYSTNEAFSDADKELNSEESSKYCRILLETLPILRNSQAHGGSGLDSGSSMVRTCAELINQLFIDPGER
jgi:hypothetical protein